MDLLVLMLITQQVGSGQSGRTWKAPKNMMFLINNIYFSPAVSENIDYWIVDYVIEDGVQVNPRNWIAVGNSSILGSIQHYHYTKPVETKYLSFVTDGNLQSVFITIDYSLKPASMTELLIEWFRKGW